MARRENRKIYFGYVVGYAAYFLFRHAQSHNVSLYAVGTTKRSCTY